VGTHEYYMVAHHMYDACAASTMRTAMQTMYSTPQSRYHQNKSKCKLHTRH